MKTEFGFDLNDLVHNIKRLKLDENESIKSFKKMFEMQK